MKFGHIRRPHSLNILEFTALRPCAHQPHAAFFHLRSFSSETSAEISALLVERISISHLRQVHARAYRFCVHQHRPVATRLICLYPVRLAVRVCQQLEIPCILTFNKSIRVTIDRCLFRQILLLVKILEPHAISPTEMQFSLLMKICTQPGNAYCIKQVHAQILRTGLGHVLIYHWILHVYIKGLGDLVSGRKAFVEGIAYPGRTVCLWTCMIDGLAKSGKEEEALKFFVQMCEKNLNPENDTLVGVLSACSRLPISDVQKWVGLLLGFIHGHGSHGSPASINTVLAYLYGKCGDVERSRGRFDQVGNQLKTMRSVLPWNVMIDAYVKNDRPMDALNLFRSMAVSCTGSKSRSRGPNHVTMVSVLKACAEIGDLNLGEWVHSYMKKKKKNRGGCEPESEPEPVLGSNRNLVTALIDMYSKCGAPERAKEVFHRIEVRDVVMLNAMITGLATNGEGEAALDLYRRMRSEFGLVPNSSTYLGVLSACAHSGYVSEGRKIFNDLMCSPSASVRMEHYACFVDLLAKAGFLEEALQLVQSMPCKPNCFVWGALLRGCFLHCRLLGLADGAFRRIVELDPASSSGYVMLSNALAVDGRWDDVESVRVSMRLNGARKQRPGCSWINVGRVVHEFSVFCSSHHPEIDSIRNMLVVLGNEMNATTCY